jgi:hypothetical protein
MKVDVASLPNSGVALCPLSIVLYCIAALVEEKQPIIMLPDHKEEDYTI